MVVKLIFEAHIYHAVSGRMLMACQTKWMTIVSQKTMFLVRSPVLARTNSDSDGWNKYFASGKSDVEWFVCGWRVKCADDRVTINAGHV